MNAFSLALALFICLVFSGQFAHAINLSNLVTANAPTITNGSFLFNGNYFSAVNGDSASVVLGGADLNNGDIILRNNGEAIFNEQSNAVNFRVEGNSDPYLFFVDGVNGRVGILTDSPSTELEVNGTVTANTFNASNAVIGTVISTTVNSTNGNFSSIVANTINAEALIGSGINLTSYNGSVVNSGLVSPEEGGTGVSNTGSFSYGSNNISLTTAGVTNITLPTTGTLATVNGSEILTNKIYQAAILNGDINLYNGNLTINDTDAANSYLVIGGDNENNGGIILASNADVVFNEQASTVNFKIEGTNDINLLFANGSSNRIGILTDNADTALDVNGTITALVVNGTNANFSLITSTTLNGTTANFSNILATTINGTVLIGDASALHSLNGSSISAGILAPARGGTGIANTVSLNYGSNNLTLNTSGITGISLPASGTLATITGTETLRNKGFDSLSINGDATLSNNGSLIVNGFNGVVNNNFEINGGNLSVTGNFTLTNTSEGNGKVLISDTNGQARWWHISSSVDINSLTTETTLDDSADFLPIYDASAGFNRKFTANKLPSNTSTVSPIAAGFATSLENDLLGEEQQIGKVMMVAFTNGSSANAPGGSGSSTFSIASVEDNNIIYKKEPSNGDFLYYTTLQKGEVFNGEVAAGTYFTSTKGMYGFSFCDNDTDDQCGPVPFGVSSYSRTQFLFNAYQAANAGTPAIGTANTGVIYIASGPLETTVTLYEDDGTTIVDGPDTINGYSMTTMFTNANAEFQIVADRPVMAVQALDGGGDYLQLMPPLATELLIWNRNCRVSALENSTLVNFYRRTGDTGNYTINPGSPVNISSTLDNGGVSNAGNDSAFAPDGALILRAEGPIFAVSSDDGGGAEGIHGIPLTSLAQRFPVPDIIGNNTGNSQSAITIASPYEGTATIYASNGNVHDTFTFTRTTSPPSTVADQLIPAAGTWNPNNDGPTTNFGPGGWVDTDVPAMCIINFSSSSGGGLFDTEGDQLIIHGITPEELEAEIIRDANGLLRKRSIDGSGNETWDLI